MSRLYISGNAVDQNQIPVVGAQVYVRAGGVNASLQDAEGNALANPLLTVADGFFEAWSISTGEHVLEYRWGGKLRYIETVSEIDRLQAIADEAATYVQAAAAFTGPFYASTDEGLAATEDGDEFNVIASVDAPTFDVYLNDGGTAVLAREGMIRDPSASGTSALLGHIASGTGAEATTIQAKLRETISVKDFGAVGDGVADDTDAIEAALAAVPTGGALYFPSGSYLTTAQIIIPQSKRLTLYGDGPRQSLLVYAGANTTNDCFVFGDGVSDCNGYQVKGLGFSTNTNMTGGALVRFRRLTRSGLSDVNFGHQDGNSNAFNAVWFDQLDKVSLNNFQCRGKEDGLRVNGGTGGRADLFLDGYKIASCKNGIHVAGDFGGLYLGTGSIINNGTNVLIDQAVTAVANREVFFGPGSLTDTASTDLDPTEGSGIGVDIQDTGGFVFFRNTWVAFAGTLIRTGSSFAGTIQIDGGILFKGTATYGGAGRGIDLGGTSAVLIVNGTLFQEITNEAIICSAGDTTSVFVNSPVFRSTVGTPLHSSILPQTSAGSQAVFNRKLVAGARAPIASSTESSPAQTFAQNAGLGSSTHIARYGADANPGRIELSKSRSATVGGHTVLQNNDVIGSIGFGGSDGTDFEGGAQMRAVVAGTPGADDMPTRLEFYTRPVGGAQTLRVTFTEAGGVVMSALPTHADNAAAVSAGLAVSSLYKTSGGEVRIVV